MTLFVILGVIIIGSIALGLYFRQQIVSTQTLKEAAETSNLPPELQSLKEEINECANVVSEEALYFVGQQGGYFLSPDNSIATEEYSVAFGVQNGVKTLASQDTLKNEVVSYVEAFLPECVDYTAYQDFEIFDQEPEASVSFNDEKSEFEIQYKVTAQKDGNAYNLFEPYEVVLPLRVKKVYETSSKIADDLVADSGNLDYSKILSYGMDVEVDTLGGDFVVVNVKDKKQDDDRNYEFQFGVSL